MSHLRPIDPETGKPKSVSAYSAEEFEHAIVQIIEDVRMRALAKLPTDRSALDRFAEEAARRGDKVQQQRIADALSTWFPAARRA